MNYKPLTVIIIILGALSTFACMAYASGDNFTPGSLVLYLFNLIPYLILWWITYKLYFKNSSKAKRVALFIISLLVAIFSVFITASFIYGPTSSTSGLVFLFLPIYSLLIIAIAYPLVKWLINILTSKI